MQNQIINNDKIRQTPPILLLTLNLITGFLKEHKMHLHKKCIFLKYSLINFTFFLLHPTQLRPKNSCQFGRIFRYFLVIPGLRNYDYACVKITISQNRRQSYIQRRHLYVTPPCTNILYNVWIKKNINQLGVAISVVITRTILNFRRMMF